MDETQSTYTTAHINLLHHNQSLGLFDSPSSLLLERKLDKGKKRIKTLCSPRFSVFSCPIRRTPGKNLSVPNLKNYWSGVNQQTKDHETYESKLTNLCFIGFKDPLRSLGRHSHRQRCYFAPNLHTEIGPPRPTSCSGRMENY